MNQQTSLFQFTNLYSLSKTLRFELIPKGKTLERIQEKGLLREDEIRAEKYKKAKKIIDEYHKWFIAKALDGFALKELETYLDLHQLASRDEKQQKLYETAQAGLRKQIVNQLKGDSDFSTLYGKTLFKRTKENDKEIDARLCSFINDLEEEQIVGLGFESKDDALQVIRDFESFTTYFKGFHDNRKNMYSEEEKSTAIANRLIHENLPRFIDNCRVFESVAASDIGGKLGELQASLANLVLSNYFTVTGFNLTLTQNGIDKYNQILGGVTSETEKPLKGLNQLINEHNQQLPRNDKKNRIPKLKPLYKQILSDRTTASFVVEAYENDEEVLSSIEELYQFICPEIQSIKEMLDTLSQYDSNMIFIKNDKGLTDISQQMFGSWSVITEALQKQYDANYTGKKKAGTEKYEEDRKKHLGRQKSYSLSFLNQCIRGVQIEGIEHPTTIEGFFGLQGLTSDRDISLFRVIADAYEGAKDTLNSPWDNSRNLAAEKGTVEKIKVFLDALKDLQWFIKPLLGNGDEAEKDERFYGDFSAHWDKLANINTVYNKVRNYMTRKPYSTEKFKLNFENSTFLDGWDVNKESDNCGVLFRKDGNFYLGIMDKQYNKALKPVFEDHELGYEKMEYKLLPGPNKMLPKVFFSKSRIDEFAPSNRILENYKKDTHKKGDSFNIEDCRELINFFKSSIYKHEDWKQFGFEFSDTESYRDLSDFYREVSHQGYRISFRNIPESYIDELVESGKLYLFQIYNKDFSPHSKGTPNLHTLYWRMLFDERNLADVVYKLNGEAEIFYRKASIKEGNQIVHKAKEAIANKNNDNPKRESLFDYDIVKDRRFTMDKFQFHVPITLNFKADGLLNINPEVNRYLIQNPDAHIIGIDRGERHLLYLVVINQKGEIKEQISLNEIVSEYREITRKTDYRQLLHDREGSRDKARKDWKTVESIKDLKEGYLSQVIQKIAQLMVRYDAIVVLEDLNMGFIRGRQKVEKQVYQKFEKMLIDKLNYLVDKRKDPKELGGTLNALQLTNPFESFQKLGKQSGFLYYVPAWNTSKMDPATGFVNLLDTRYKNVEESQKFFSKFRNISYQPNDGSFVFHFDYSDFHHKSDGARIEWKVVANDAVRYRFDRTMNNGHGGQEPCVVSQELKSLFAAFQIPYANSDDLRDAICSVADKEFFVKLLKLLSVTLSLRHNNGKHGTEEEDYILSPVADDLGVFFDSRKGIQSMPLNADANGAYNIARKGLWIIEELRKSEDIKKTKLAIKNVEWLKFAQLGR